ncbi:MAG TPA: hypothetical protein DGC76_10915 [Candidatus Accumulibacter sp.]|nr:hypothetical protein [Accumulibacter sp.]
MIAQRQPISWVRSRGVLGAASAVATLGSRHRRRCFRADVGSAGGRTRNWPILVAACAPVSRCWLECT